MTVKPAGTSGIPMGQEYWKQEAAKKEAEEKAGPTPWKGPNGDGNVPVGQEAKEAAKEIVKGAKIIASGKSIINAGAKFAKKIAQLPKSKKPKQLDGANVISSKVTVYKKVKDGYEVEMPANNEMEMIVRYDPLAEARKNSRDFIRNHIPEADREEFDKNPEEYIRKHPPFPLTSCDVDCTKDEE